MKLSCVECQHTHDDLPADCACPDCNGLLEVVTPTPDFDALGAADWRHRPLGVWRYREFMPVPAGVEPITLHEGGTPLIDMPRLAADIGVKRLRVKYEGLNPTGSFKDRGMTAAVTRAVADGAELLACASTGNTAASMAAYAARAGKRGVVLLPAGQVAIGKIAQSLAHGADVLEIEGSFDDAMAIVADLAAAGTIAMLNSKNPIRLEGQKSLMYEVLDQCGADITGSLADAPAIPDRVVYPVGNAGNISAGHKALREYQAAGLIEEMPILTGSQAAGAAPIARAIADGTDGIEPVLDPDTIATAIRIGRPVSTIKALRAIRETGGTATSVSDDLITAEQGNLARAGVFCEPASAASVAGLRALVAEGAIEASEDVVCVLTGHGLKDPTAAQRLAAAPVRLPATIEAISEHLERLRGA